MEQPVLVLPPELIEALVNRVVERLPSLSRPSRGSASREVAAHLGCRPQRVYDLVSRRATSGIPHRKEGARLLFRLSQIDVWIESGRASAC